MQSQRVKRGYKCGYKRGCMTHKLERIRWILISIQGIPSWKSHEMDRAGARSRQDFSFLSLSLFLLLLFPNYYCTILSDITGILNFRFQKTMDSCVRFIFGKLCNTNTFLHSFWSLAGAELRLKEEISYAVCSFLSSIRMFFKFCTASLYLGRMLPCESLALFLIVFDVACICRTERFRRSFRFYMAHCWNNSRSNIKSTKSVSDFKEEYFHSLVNNSYWQLCQIYV